MDLAIFSHRRRLGGALAAIGLAIVPGKAVAQFGLDEPGFADLIGPPAPADAAPAASALGVADPLRPRLDGLREEFRQLYVGTPLLRSRRVEGKVRLALYFESRSGWTSTVYPGLDEATRRAATVADQIFAETEAAALVVAAGQAEADTARVRLGFLRELRAWAESTDIVRPDRSIFRVFPRDVGTPVFPAGDPVTPVSPPGKAAQAAALATVEGYLEAGEGIRAQMLDMAAPVAGTGEDGARLRMDFHRDREPPVEEFHGLVADLQWNLLAARGIWNVATSGRGPDELPPEFEATDRRGQRLTRWAEETFFRWREKYLPFPRDREETLLLPRRGLWPAGDEEPPPEVAPDEAPAPAAQPQAAEEPPVQMAEAQGTPEASPEAGASETVSPAEIDELIAFAKASASYVERDRTLIAAVRRLAPRLDAEGARSLIAATYYDKSGDAAAKAVMSAEGRRFTPDEAVRIAKAAGSKAGQDQALRIYVAARPGPHDGSAAVRLAAAGYYDTTEDHLVRALVEANQSNWDVSQVVAVAKEAGTYRGRDIALLAYARARAAQLSAAEGVRLAEAAYYDSFQDEIVRAVRTELLQ